MDALVKGLSKFEDVILLLTVFWDFVAQFQLNAYLDRTPTDENISDGVSREDLSVAKSCSWIMDQPSLDSLFGQGGPAEAGRPAGTTALAERSRPEEEAGLPVVVPAAGQTKPDTPFPRVGNTFRSREEVMGAEGSLEAAHCPPGPLRSPPGGKRRGRKVLPTAVALAEAPPWQELDGKIVRLEDRVHADALAWRAEMSELRIRMVELDMAAEVDRCAGTSDRDPLPSDPYMTEEEADELRRLSLHNIELVLGDAREQVREAKSAAVGAQTTAEAAVAFLELEAAKISEHLTSEVDRRFEEIKAASHFHRRRREMEDESQMEVMKAIGFEQNFQALADLKRLMTLEFEELRRGPRFVYRPGAECYHAVASAHPLMSPDLHETRCGWKFGLSTEARRFDAEPMQLSIRKAGVAQQVRPCQRCWS